MRTDKLATIGLDLFNFFFFFLRQRDASAHQWRLLFNRECTRARRGNRRNFGRPFIILFYFFLFCFFILFFIRFKKKLKKINVSKSIFVLFFNNRSDSNLSWCFLANNVSHGPVERNMQNTGGHCDWGWPWPIAWPLENIPKRGITHSVFLTMVIPSRLPSSLHSHSPGD